VAVIWAKCRLNFKTMHHEQRNHARHGPFRAPLISRLEIRATLCSGDYLRLGLKHEKIFPHGSNGNVAGDLQCCDHASACRRRRRCGRAHRRPRCGDHYRRCRHRPALLQPAAGLCSARAILLLDARRARMGCISGRVDLSCRQSLRITRVAERLTRACRRILFGGVSSAQLPPCPFLIQLGHWT
jgi:hypothetical protein